MTLPMKKKSCAGSMQAGERDAERGADGVVAEAGEEEPDVLGREDSPSSTPAARTISMVVRMTESARSPPSSSPASR